MGLGTGLHEIHVLTSNGWYTRYAPIGLAPAPAIFDQWTAPRAKWEQAKWSRDAGVKFSRDPRDHQPLPSAPSPPGLLTHPSAAKGIDRASGNQPWGGTPRDSLYDCSLGGAAHRWDPGSARPVARLAARRRVLTPPPTGLLTHPSTARQGQGFILCAHRGKSGRRCRCWDGTSW